MSGTVAKYDPLIIRALHELPEWAQAKVFPRLSGYPSQDDCWIWTGYVRTTGYGSVALPAAVRGREIGPALTHRVVWIALRGPIDHGLVLDHDGEGGCHNKACANPMHLEAVNPRTNSITGNSPAAANVNKTRCPKGHALIGDNLVSAAVLRGGRNCRTCHMETAKRQYSALRAAAQELGITNREYIRRHGQSTEVALSIVTELVGSK